MDLDGLRSFLKVVKMNSISRAAERLHVSQPTLSARISKLEEGLGFTLFKRSWKGVELTKQGYYFLPYAIQLLQDIGSASTVLTSYLGEDMTSFEEVIKNTNRLQIGVDDWLHPIFINLITEIIQSNFPNLEYKFITKSSQTIYDLLKYQGLHLGVFYGEDTKKELTTQTLKIDEMVLIYYANEPFNVDIDLKNFYLLNDKPFILFDNPILSHHSYITKSIISTLEINKFHIVDNIHVMLNLVSSGYGYTIIPESSVATYKDNELYPLEFLSLRNRFPNINIFLSYSNLEQFEKPIVTIINQLTSHLE